MNKLLLALRGDLLRQWRYNLIVTALVVTILYALILIPMRQNQMDKAMLFLIFSDPVALGMLFIGALILFERSDRTLEALVVTPLKAWQYLWAKAISLSLLGVFCSLVMLIVGFGWNIPVAWFIIGVGLSSLIFVFLGFIIVASCTSFYQYMLKMGISLIPVALPLLNFIELTDTRLWYIIPTQATLILMETVVKFPSIGDLVYSVLYLLIWCFGSFYFALRAFNRYLSR